MEEQRGDVVEEGVGGVVSPLEVVKVAVKMVEMPVVTSPLEVVQAEVGWWVVSPVTVDDVDDVMERRGLEDVE